MTPERLFIRDIDHPSGDLLDFEIVERKGLGHPDTICDEVAEQMSLALSRLYLLECGKVLHHNVDKALLAGGASSPRFGGGEISRPIELFVAGRATGSFQGKDLPIEDLAHQVAAEWFAKHLPTIDTGRDIKVRNLVRPGSADLTDLFARRSGRARLANDTSCGVGYAPLSRLETNNSNCLLLSEPSRSMQSKYLPAEERRSLTVEAVVVLSGAQNPSEITTAAIAKHMNVTQGALFRHFPTKDAIWEAVMEWVTNRLLDRIDHAAEGACSPMDGLRAMFMSHIEFVIEYPGVPRMMFGELQRAEAAPATKIARMLIKRYAERLAKKLEEAKAAGEAANDLDTHAAAILFIGMIQGLVMQSLLSGDIKGVRTHAHGVLGIYLRGVKSGASDAETLNARTPRGKIRR